MYAIYFSNLINIRNEVNNIMKYQDYTVVL